MSTRNPVPCLKTLPLAALALIAGLSVPGASAAGEGGVGNGGNAVVCWDSGGKIASVELLDYYEARTELGFAIDLGAPELDPTAKTLIALGRLGQVAPKFVRWMNYVAQTFVSQNADFIANATLTPVQDSNQIAVPAGCQIDQLAIQKPAALSNQKTYTINKDLWDLLDNNNKAGLILHEILYTQALQAGATDSVGVRYFNGFISSHQVDSADPYTLLQIEQRVPLQYFEYQGHEFKIVAGRYPYFSAHSGAFIGGPTNLSQGVKVDGEDRPVKEIYYEEHGAFIQRVVVANPVSLEFHGFPLTFTGELMLDQNGKVRRGRVSPQSYFDFESPQYSLKPGQVAPGGDYPSFVAEDDSGQITECGNCEGWVTVMGQKIEVTRSGNATDESYDFFNPETFAESGIRTLHIARNATFSVLGNSITLSGEATFYEEGNEKYDLATGKLTAPGPFLAGNQVMNLQLDFQLYADGHVWSGTLADDTTLVDVAGNSQLYPKGMHVEFDGKGLLENAQW